MASGRSSELTEGTKSLHQNAAKKARDRPSSVWILHSGRQVMTNHSFVAQGDHRIDAGGATRRNVAGQQRGSDEQQRHAAES
jgi:hypothetical protein